MNEELPSGCLWVIAIFVLCAVLEVLIFTVISIFSITLYPFWKLIKD